LIPSSSPRGHLVLALEMTHLHNSLFFFFSPFY
jgi:hypothetical protein